MTLHLERETEFELKWLEECWSYCCKLEELPDDFLDFSHRDKARILFQKYFDSETEDVFSFITYTRKYAIFMDDKKMFEVDRSEVDEILKEDKEDTLSVLRDLWIEDLIQKGQIGLKIKLLNLSKK